MTMGEMAHSTLLLFIAIEECPFLLNPPPNKRNMQKADFLYYGQLIIIISLSVVSFSLCKHQDWIKSGSRYY
jgi:hypothetical protein